LSQSLDNTQYNSLVEGKEINCDDNDN